MPGSSPGMTANSLDNRHMPRRVTRRGAVEARIVLDLDLPPEGAKAKALIEGDRARMIVGAGVQPDPRDRPRPCKLQRAVHQPAAGAAADQFCSDAEKYDLALSRFAKIQLQQAFVAAVMRQRV